MLCYDDKQLLDLVLNELIPASEDGRVPAAGDLGVASFFLTADVYIDSPSRVIDEVLICLREKTNDFQRMDSAARVAVLKLVEAETGQAFASLVRMTYMGYYSRADVRPLFGVGVHPVHPQGYSVTSESDKHLEVLTAPVRERGSIYRSTVTVVEEKP